MHYQIANISTLPMWNALGQPSLEFQIKLASKHVGTSIVQSGLSTGSKEKAFNLFNYDNLALDKLLNKNFISYKDFDEALTTLISKSYSILPNVTSSISIAFAKAAASASNLPLWSFLSDQNVTSNFYPTPLFCALSGGVHGDFSIDVQDIMIIPQKVSSLEETLQKAHNIFYNLKKILLEKGQWGGYSIKGAYLPRVNNIESALDSVIEAIEKTGFSLEDDFTLGLDVAAATLWDQVNYTLPQLKKSLTTNQFIRHIDYLARNYPIKFLEDPLRDDDIEGYLQLKARLPSSIYIIGDDLSASKVEHILTAHHSSVCNGFIIKPSQAGTLTEVKNVLNTIREINSLAVISGRSGDNEQFDLMDIAWAWGVPYFKIGGFSGAEIIAKYNQGLRIEKTLRS